MLAEFTDTDAWRNRQRQAGQAAPKKNGLYITPWRARLTKGGRELVGAVNDEIDALIRLAEDERADALGEILSQSNEFITHFMSVLCATPGSHPATGAVIEAASFIAGLAAQHFKMLEDRRRPSQVCAALRPPMEVPGHASYPSGHATQAFLIARTLEAVLDGTPSAAAQPVVEALAERIARNREIAGFHYPSDTAAGRELAAQLWDAIENRPLFSAAVGAAHAEWS